MNKNIFKIARLGTSEFANPSLPSWTLHLADEDGILYNPYWNQSLSKAQDEPPLFFQLAGPREKIFFQPKHTKAAIVTCGGLCPGINAVIRTIVRQLYFRYGVQDIIGIPFGYRGLGSNNQKPFLKLTVDVVDEIDSRGGSLLGSSRGTPPTGEIVDTLESGNIQQLYTIGGDGTMRGALEISEEIKRRNLKISVIGLPKTIDNDIPFVKRSFGYQTAVARACESLISAHNEARGTPNGLGIVKLMGRHAGYIAASATQATGLANFCLIPEVPFKLEGKTGLLALLEKRFLNRDHALIVVAEGAGQEYFKDDGKRDASGNTKMGDIGLFLKEKIQDYFREKNIELSVKYIDPSYLIRAAHPTPIDALLCSEFAQAAVHAAMAGKTGLLIGNWHGQMTHVPFKALIGKSQRIDPNGNLWFNILETTGQPAQIGIGEEQ